MKTATQKPDFCEKRGFWMPFSRYDEYGAKAGQAFGVRLFEPGAVTHCRCARRTTFGSGQAQDTEPVPWFSTGGHAPKPEVRVSSPLSHLCYNPGAMIRLLRALVRILGLLILVAVLAFGWLVWQVDRVGRQDHARSSDAIVVLGARVEKDGQPGPDLRSRTEHAVALWKAGLAPQIICTGGYKNERLSAASVCRRFAAELGVPTEQVWLADGSQSTYEDAEAASAVMAAHGWRSAILVSHPLHLYRALWFFRDAGVDAVTSPTSTNIDGIDLPDRIWLATREAGAVVVTKLDTRGLLPARWTARLQALKMETGY